MLWEQIVKHGEMGQSWSVRSLGTSGNWKCVWKVCVKRGTNNNPNPPILFSPLCCLKTQFPTFCVFVLRGEEKKTHKHSVVGTNRKAGETGQSWSVRSLGTLGSWKCVWKVYVKRDANPQNNNNINFVLATLLLENAISYLLCVCTQGCRKEDPQT